MDAQSLKHIEEISARVVSIGLVAGGFGYALTWFNKSKRLYAQFGALGALAAFAGTVGVFASRAYQGETPRLPLTNLYEFSILFVAGIILFYLFASLKWDLRQAGMPVLMIGLAVFLIGGGFYREVEPTVVPALNSMWLNIHVLTAMFAYGPLAVAAITGAYALVKYHKRREDDSSPEVAEGKEKPLTGDDLDDITYRAIAFAFPWLTALIVTGAIWAQSAWGRYWAWDAKEVWSLITWIIYAAYLHARLLSHWRGWKTSAFGVIGFVLVIFTWIGIQYLASVTKLIQSLHLY